MDKLIKDDTLRYNLSQRAHHDISTLIGAGLVEFKN